MSEAIQAVGLICFVVGVFVGLGLAWGLAATGVALYFVGEAVDR